MEAITFSPAQNRPAPRRTTLMRTLVMTVLLILTAPVTTLWAQEMNEKFSMTTQMFLNELKESKEPSAVSPRHAPVHRSPDGTAMPKPRRLIASPDTVGSRVYISCFIHLKDTDDLSAVEALGVEIEETFDGLDFVTACVPVEQIEALAGIDNVTKIKVAQQMRPMTDVARQRTNVDDLLTQSVAAAAAGVNSKYDGTGVVLGIIDTGIDFQHIAFKDKDGHSRIKRAYVYNGSSAQEYTTITSTAPTTDDNTGDHGTHTATTAGGSSVIVNGTTVTVTDNHANATYGGMAPGADLYLAGVNGLPDTYLTNALKKMVAYADDQGKPLVVNNSWGSTWGPRDGTGEWADLVATYFGDSHPNHIILFAASNDAGHSKDNEGGGFFVKKSSVSDSDPLGTIIRSAYYSNTDGGYMYQGLIACAWASQSLNCKIHVLDNSTGAILQSWTVTQNNTKISEGLDTYYDGSMTVYIEKENGKYRLAVYSEDGIVTQQRSGSRTYFTSAYTLAIEVYPESGSADINMWSGDWSFFTNLLTTSDHTWLEGTDDMCVSDEATIPDVISVGAYVSKNKVKNYEGLHYSYHSGTLGDIADFSSFATAAQSPTGLDYPWITAPGAQLVAGVNHYHTTSIDDYSYFAEGEKSSLVVNNSSSPYGVMQGTSMATPVAAGIVALWLQASMDANAAHKNLTVNDVKDIMAATAINDSYTTTGVNASHFGKGKIDALAGIHYILGANSYMRATPTSIDFADKNPYATRSYTQILNVKGFDLEGDITATLSDANGVYSLSQTTITQSDAASGIDITITYAPQSAGTHDASITLSSSNATDVVVSLTATAQAATPFILAEPESLIFTTELNEQKSQTIDVLSEFLTGDISVSLTDANNVFTLDKTSITKADSEEGATVSVTFQSATAGTFTGTVTLTSAGADPVTVNLSATAASTLDETIDFTKQGYANGDAVTSVNGINCIVSFDKGTNSNGPKYYDSGTAIRMYGGNTMTIASSTKTISKIEITFGSSDGSNVITTDVATYSNSNWTGSAKSVTFTIGGTSGNRRIQQVKVTYKGSKQDVTMAFSPATATATMGESFTEPTLTTTPANLTVTYSSSDTGVATINSNTGAVTLVAAGTTTITATFAGDDSYNSGSASYTLTVSAAQASSGDEFALITQADEFVEGDYIIVYNGGAMKASVSSNRLDYENVTSTNNVITTTEASIIWHIAPSGDYYTIYNAGENKFAASTGTKNQAQLLTSGTDDKSLWSVTKGATFEFVNKYNTAKSVNANLRRNGDYGFACYSTQTGGALSLYKRTSGGSNPVDPTIAYYKNADGKQGSALKTAMSGIIYNRIEKSYDYLWTAYHTTDVRSDGKIWDMYSNITNYEPGGSAQGANFSEEGDSYNREHSFPKSWFGGEVMPMYTDLHHLYPVDGYVNNRHSNYPFGETNGETYKSANDFSKLGACTYPGYTDKVFEPADEYKGDFARTYFYMITCYEEKLPDWYNNFSSTTEVGAVIDGSTYPGFQTWQLNMLMKWAKNDPVSEKETNRNNAVYVIQNNRNPFIDYPGLEEYIWGTMTTTAFSYDNYVQPVYKLDVTMAFSPTEASVTIGEDFTEPTLTTNPANLAVSYSSSEPSVATVDAGTGDVTLVAAGTTTITATFAGDDTYNSGSASYTLTVSDPALVMGERLLYEGVSSYTGSDSSAELTTSSDYLNYKNWSSITKVYPGGNTHSNGGCLKFGSGSAAGSMTTGNISLTGAGTLTFYLKQYGSDSGKLNVTVTGATADITEFTPASTWTLCTVNLTEAKGFVTITLATSSKRAYVDEITLTSNNTLDLANNSDNATIIAAAATNGGKFDVTLSDRTLYKNGAWNTLCLPFNLMLSSSILSGADVRTLSNTSFNSTTGELTLDFTEKGNVTELMAGSPYIIRWVKSDPSDPDPDNLVNPVFSGVTISKATNNVTTTCVDFIGTTSPVGIYTEAHDNLFLGSGNTLYYPNIEGYKVNACRAYFHLHLDSGNGANAIRAFALNFGDDATEIETVNHEPLTDNQVYDLAGRRLDGVPTTKGIYIVNGKKVIVK